MTQTSGLTQVSRIAVVIVVLALALIVVSGFERQVQTDAGCGSWGVCSGWQFLSSSSGAVGTMHLAVAAQLGIMTIGLLGYSWLSLRDDRRVVIMAVAAFALLLVQLGAMFVPATGSAAVWAATVHLGATTLLMALAVLLSLLPVSVRLQQSLTPNPTALGPFKGIVFGSVCLLFLVLVSGAYVSSADPGYSCTEWPLCGMTFDGALDGTTTAQVTHQLLVGAAGATLIALAIVAVRLRHRLNATGIIAGLLGVFAIEVIIGAVSASGVSSSRISAAHYGVAGLSWALLVGLLVATPRVPRSLAAHETSTRHTIIRDYLRVTKPGIMLLLLTTTLGAMLIAGSGWPSLPLILATLLGGALASGGASALNCYLDRDIDVIMARTRSRPIPTGGLTPIQVRNFGLLLSVLAVAELAILVNPFAALLALAGNLFYVVIYTRFLKRSTPQNIVIGGAAGAFPPLVGWAAVTGTVSLTSILLFAIIYYWTPPHFWSLALLKARDYGRAGIPMLPSDAWRPADPQVHPAVRAPAYRGDNSVTCCWSGGDGLSRRRTGSRVGVCVVCRPDVC